MSLNKKSALAEYKGSPTRNLLRVRDLPQVFHRLSHGCLLKEASPGLSVVPSLDAVLFDFTK